MFVIATLIGGTTIGGYPAVHTGMKQINLTGKISMVNPADDVFIEMQAFNNPASIVRFYSTEDGGGITSSGSIALAAADGLSLQGISRTSLHSDVEIDLNAPSVKVSGNLKWNNGADSLDALKSSVSSGKTSIASAITAKGVAATGSDTHAQLATKIGSIEVGDYSVGDTIPNSDYNAIYDMTQIGSLSSVTLTLDSQISYQLEFRKGAPFFNESIIVDWVYQGSSFKIFNVLTGAQMFDINIGTPYFLHVSVTKDYIYTMASDYYFRIYSNTGSLVANVYPTNYTSMGAGYIMGMATDYSTNTCTLMFWKQINGQPNGSSCHFVKFINTGYTNGTSVNLATECGTTDILQYLDRFHYLGADTLIVIPSVNTFTHNTIAYNPTLGLKWKSNQSDESTFDIGYCTRPLTNGMIYSSRNNGMKKFRESDGALIESLALYPWGVSATGIPMWDGKLINIIRNSYATSPVGSGLYTMYTYDPALPLSGGNFIARSKTQDLNSFFTKNINSFIEPDKEGIIPLQVLEAQTSGTGSFKYGKFKRNPVASSIILK